MKPISLLKYLQLCFFGTPKCDRAIYGSIKRNRVRSIVEFGLGDASRSKNLIRIAQRFSGSAQVRYTGIDQFEGRPESEPRLELIAVHRELTALKAKTQLVPGTFGEAIPRIANSHLRTDLIVVSSCHTTEELNSCWAFLPRMLHATSTLMLQTAGDRESQFQILTRMEIERVAKRLNHRSEQNDEAAVA